MAGGAALPGEIVETAFADVTSPARLEVVRSSPTIVIDGAHNPAGAEALVGALDEVFDFSRLIGVVGILVDKDAEGLLERLEPVLTEVVITRASSVRSYDLEELTEIAQDIFGEDRVRTAEKLDAALDIAVTVAESEDMVGVGTGVGVLVTGSILLAAEARILLGKG